MADDTKTSARTCPFSVLKWTKCLYNIPKIDSNTIINFLKKTGKKDIGPKGYKLFAENYIHDVYTSSLHDCQLVKSRSFRTQRKGEKPHSLQTEIDKSGNCQKSNCSCKAGSGGHCNHVVGLLYLLCHWSLLGIKEIPADKTCTSLPQPWHKPRPTDKIEPEPVMKSTFAKSWKDKENKRKRDPIACKLYNADAKRMKSINGRERDILAMSYTLSQEKRKPPFSYLLGDQQCSQIINTVLGNVPLGSYLGYQLFDERKQKVNFSLDRPVTEILTFDNQPDLILAFPKIPLPVNADNNEYERLISERPAEEHSFLQKIRVTTTEAYQIQNLTVQQSLCADWYKYREPRITASNFGRVLTRKMKPTEAFMKSLFQQNDLSKVEAIKHGKQHESLARSIYARKMQKNVNKLFTVYECGLSINPLYPYLGASPDGKIFDPSEKNHFGLLEIKCPFKWRNRSLDEACEDPTFHCHVINGKVHLKRMNVYYAQVQGQLLLTGLSWCDFVVYLSTSRHMNVERIYLDMDYCNFTLLPKLKELYFEHAIKYLMNKV